MDPNAANSWGWLALALVNAGLAEQKNRSRLSWFLLSLLLGPFATLYIVAWPRLPAVQLPAPPIQLSTWLLAGGSVLTIVAAVLGVLAGTSELWGLWWAAGLLGAAALGCFVGFIARRPRDVEAARVPDDRVAAGRE